MAISVVRSFNWRSIDIDNLYLDCIDYHGLEFWYEDVKLQINKNKNP
jgi:hypothetical protein